MNAPFLKKSPGALALRLHRKLYDRQAVDGLLAAQAGLKVKVQGAYWQVSSSRWDEAGLLSALEQLLVLTRER